MKGRCQICGRSRGLTRAGALPAHYVQGAPCPGAGAAPIERDDALLQAEARRARDEASRQLRAIVDLFDRRVNRIEPHILQTYSTARARADRLERRLARHIAWPRRFRREMERLGYGSPPPAYLLERQAHHSHQSANFRELSL